VKERKYYRFRTKNDIVVIVPDIPHEIWCEEVMCVSKNQVVGILELDKKLCQELIKVGRIS